MQEKATTTDARARGRRAARRLLDMEEPIPFRPRGLPCTPGQNRTVSHQETVRVPARYMPRARWMLLRICGTVGLSGSLRIASSQFAMASVIRPCFA